MKKLLYTGLLSIFIFIPNLILPGKNPAKIYEDSLNLIKSEGILTRSDSLMSVGAFTQNNAELSEFIRKCKREPEKWGQKLNPVFTKLVASYGGAGQMEMVRSTLLIQSQWIKKYGGTALDLGKFLHNYGQVNLIDKNYKTAIQAFKLALIFKKFSLPFDLKTTIITYRELAYAYARSYNYRLASKYYQTSLSLIKKLKEPDSYLESSIIEKYTSLLYAYDEFETIRKLLDHALELPYQNEFLKTESLLFGYINLIDHVFMPTNDFSSVRKYLAYSRQLLNKHPEFNQQFKDNLDLYDAITDYQMHNYASSLPKFQKVISPILKNKQTTYFQFAIENCVYMMYECALALQQFRLAREYLETYINLSSKDVLEDPMVVIENKLLEHQIAFSDPAAKSSIDSLNAIALDNNIKIDRQVTLEDVLSKPNLEIVFRLLTSIYKKIFQTNAGIQTGENLLNLVMRRLEVRNIRQSVGLSNSITISQYNTEHELVQQGLELCDYLQKKTGAEYSKTALQLIERDKSNQLYVSIQRSASSATDEVPDEIKKTEQLVEQKVRSYMAENISAKERVKSKQDILEIQKEHRILIDNILKNYPGYFMKKYNNNFFDPEQFLSNRKLSACSYIDFLTTAEKVYSVIITDKNKLVFKVVNLDTPEWQEKYLSPFVRLLAKKPRGSDNADLEQFQNLNKGLTKFLLDPFDSLISKNIVIVPDIMLANLPFEALCLKADKDEQSWKDLNYLVKSKNIAYAPSLKFLSGINSAANIPTKSFLGVAYSPEQTNNLGLSSLTYANKEVEDISRELKGEYISQRSSTFERIKEKASAYKFLHFACHAKSDTANGNGSFLVLFDSATQAPCKVFASEFYSLDLKSELVTLSACESALGQNYVGEGVIGLTRAFFYAGTKSVLSTLWNVSDYQAGVILTGFYSNLTRKESKNLALANSKRSYLKNAAGIFAHPFYWAPYQISGKETDAAYDVPKTIYLSILICLVVVVYLSRKLLKSK